MTDRWGVACSILGLQMIILVHVLYCICNTRTFICPNPFLSQLPVQIIYVAPMKALASEMVRNFSGRLSALGIVVKELTGDMQLTKHEILNTQVMLISHSLSCKP